MKTLYKILILVSFILMGIACEDEEKLTPSFEYPGPIPAITEGTTPAQKICYDLYQKYDLHVYYTLSGQEALQTDIGWTQINMIEWYAPDALPMQAGDEATSLAFLQLMQKFYNLLPEDLVKSSVLKRNVLVKVNATANDYYEFYSIGFTGEAQQGIAYWGEMDDEIGVQPEVWKYSLCLGYFDAQSNDYYTNNPKPIEFGNISKGFYAGEQDDYWGALGSLYDEEGNLNMPALMEWGFVNPIGFANGDSEHFQNTDLATYAAWIACTPLANRQESLETYPLVKQKYDLTLRYFKTYLKIDLEEFSKTWSNLIVE